MKHVQPDKTASLLARARQRDEEALAELLEAHAQRLLESIRSELGDRLRQRLESQDVMQQVFMDVLRDIDQFVDAGHDSFFAWLRRIALNRICDADRKAFQTLKRGAEVRVGDVERAGSLAPLLETLTGSLTSPSRAPGRGGRGAARSA